MKKLLQVWTIVFFASCISIPNLLAANIALNTNVTLTGTFFTGGWGSTTIVGPETIVDGVFLPENTQWDQGPVWWDAREIQDQSITIDLGGMFDIDSFIVQADNNDTYRLEYLNNSTLEWIDIGTLSGWGMMTRPEIFLPSTITTDSLRFTATGGDGLYAVSEIQAFGSAAVVPEPGTMLLMGIGLLAAAGSGIRRKKLRN